ncbi:MAG: hypothetical protein K9H26_19335 [Prolixibacteraceae bacterium]|nr:hypothetical protein [Prolixibacteraceae bacterium]
MKSTIMKLSTMGRIILLFLIIIPLTLFAQKEVTWDYPINPETKEWSNLKSYDERLNAYNIPGDILENMSTAELVKTCLAYPEFRLIMTRNSLQEGYGYLKSIFNGFEELEKREDIGNQLINEYRKLNPVDVQAYDKLVEQGRFVFRFTYLEILLAQRPLLLSMSNNTKKELLELSISNYEGKLNLPEYYASFGLETSSLVLGRLLDTDKYQAYISMAEGDECLRKFIDSSILYDKSSLSAIVNLAKNYKNQLKNE